MRSLKLIASGLAVLLSNSVFGSADCTENCVAKMVTDFSGKPPFKRRIEMVPMADIAQVEIVKSVEVGLVEVKTIDFRGKPPFKRRTKLLEKTDVMEVEITSEPEAPGKRKKRGTGNSFFKRH
jgi:hypothetical protein